MAAIKRPDGSLELPLSVNAPGLSGDGTEILRPGDAGYDEAAATAIPADQHPFLRPRDLRRSAELAALFGTWDEQAATA